MGTHGSRWQQERLKARPEAGAHGGGAKAGGGVQMQLYRSQREGQ